MDKDKLKYFKNKLIQEKNDTIDTLNSMRNNNPNESMPKYFDELSMYDNHPADLGTEMFMAEQAMNLENVEKLRLNEVEDSLEKIEKGTYGECDICGDKISEERLDILPEAKTCLECANKKIPIKEMMHDRPVEEDNLKFPFGRTFNDVTKEEVSAFDGEDSWQAVARFNEIQKDPSHQGGDNQGIFDDTKSSTVEDVENISEGYHNVQTQDLNQEDIPEEQMIKKNRHDKK